MVGNMARALAGKEKGQVFVVVREENGFVYIADGKRLKKQKPKKKNLKHIQVYKTICMDKSILEVDEERVNAAIAKFLKERSENV